MLLPRFVPGRPAEWYAALGQRLFEGGLALLLILSEVFSSNIQATLPRFSQAARLGLTGAAVLLLAAKLLLLTEYPRRWQPAVVLVVLAYTGFAALYGGDRWFFLAALAGLAAFGVDLRRALRVYVITAAAGLALVQLLHLVTPLVPFNFYCGGWDFGYGHYNGYGARLLGVFLAWAWLRFDRLRLWDWAGLAALALYTLFFVTARGAGGAMLIVLALLALCRLCPALFRTRLFAAAAALVWPALTVLSAWLSTVGNFEDPPNVYLWVHYLDRILSGRLDVWYRIFRPGPFTVFGGRPTDGDPNTAIDNAYLAAIINKGVLGAVLIGLAAVVLVWRLARRGHGIEAVLAIGMMAYLMMENKPFLLSADPLVLLAPCLLLTPPGAPLPLPEDT